MASKGGGGGSTTRTPPTAVGTVVTPNPHGGSPVTLSGAGSSPGSGHIISYEWDFNNDGKIDTSTGTNPIAHVILPTGLHNIGLTVTNSNGEKSSSKFGVLLQGVSIPPSDGGEGPCLTSLEVANAELLAECIQTKGSGEWVIESKELELNGMVLVAQGRRLWDLPRHLPPPIWDRHRIQALRHPGQYRAAEHARSAT